MPEALPNLFSPIDLAETTLPNRIAMAPMARQMAEPDGTPTDEMLAYYQRRARGGAGLIITEGTFGDTRLGCRGYLSQPGIVTGKHIAAWQKIAAAIHAQGAKCILQLVHAGRLADPRSLAPGEQPVSASDTQSPGCVLYTDTDYEARIRGIAGPWPKIPYARARALTIAEIEDVALGFAEGAERAVEAGFDGVEIHGANGYLIYQFIHPSTNQRDDAFGGSAAGRLRFVRLVCEKVRTAIGSDKIISLRLSQDAIDDRGAAWPGGVAAARELGTALQGAAINALHWASYDYRDNRDPTSDVPMSTALREASLFPMIANGGIAQGAEAEAAIVNGAADIVAVGRPMIGNPDWPLMVRDGAPVDLVPFDRKLVVHPPLDESIPHASYQPPVW